MNIKSIITAALALIVSTACNGGTKQDTARAWHKLVSASCCNVVWSSYRSQPTKNA